MNEENRVTAEPAKSVVTVGCGLQRDLWSVTSLNCVVFENLMFNRAPFPQEGLTFAWECDFTPTLRNFYHQNEC